MKISHVFLVVVLVLVALGGGYSYYKNSNSQLQAPSIAVDSSWETYANKTHGFSFQYPATLLVRSNSTDDSIILVGDENGPWVYDIETIEILNTSSLDEQVNSYTERYANRSQDFGYELNVQVSDTTIANVPAKKVFVSNYGDTGNTTYLLVRDNKLIELHGTSDPATGHNPEMDIIVNSLKFN